MNTDRAQIARLGLDKHRQKLNAFIEQISPNAAHTHDDDAFIVRTNCHNIELHLWATPERVEVRGKVHGAPILPTFPARFEATIMERCAEVIVDGLSTVHYPMMDTVPAWTRDAVDRDLVRRAEGLASLAGASKTLALGDAIAVVEEELVKRGPVYPERAIPALMELGLSCPWVKERPKSQRLINRLNADEKSLQDAVERAGAQPYMHVDAGREDDQPGTLYLGWEVITCDSLMVLLCIRNAALQPGPLAFTILCDELSTMKPADIIGDGPVAVWARARCLQK